jgi:hypothetical protein
MAKDPDPKQIKQMEAQLKKLEKAEAQLKACDKELAENQKLLDALAKKIRG